jgi:pSer/pThr/pTyr-binding forkhead associated (FHA) protein
VDPILDVFPEIDLSHEGELSKSVSRRHAAIARQGEIVVIEDTGSVNGTFVNGKRLDPYLPEIIKSGDILQLGKLQLEIEIIKQ